jgi:hypothetical protein
MNKWLHIGFLILLTGNLDAQMISHEVIAVGGDYAVNGAYNISATFGEIVTETYYFDNHFLTQGFQQPSVAIDPGNIEKKGGIEVSAFPNPVLDYLNVVISLPVQNGGEEVIRDYRLDIRKLTGNLVLSRKVTGLPSKENIEAFDFSAYSPGIYVVRVISLDDDQTINLTFKIVKM